MAKDEYKGPERRERPWLDRNAPKLTVLLVGLNFLTLVVAIGIIVRQSGTLSEVDNRSCHNSALLIADKQVQLDQLRDKPLMRTFYPTVSEDQLDTVIKNQGIIIRSQIHEAKRGCSPEQLDLPPGVISRVPRGAGQ